MPSRYAVMLLAAGSFALAAAAPARWFANLPVGVNAPPVPAENPMTPAKVELGRRLFYDADLSVDGTIACATCHEQKRGFTEGNRTHGGVTGEPGRRNVPGLANVAWFSPLTLADPRQTTLEDQVAIPLLGTHPVEMGMRERAGEITIRLERDPCYRTMFAHAFPESRGRIDLGNVSKAIASFERTLVSYGSAYDRGALSPDAAKGQMLFAEDCASCHAGPRFTDLRYHRLGTLDRAAPDQGLEEITGREDDRGVFRTPSLRNVMLSGPWWHDGSAGTLDEAIARHGNIYLATQMIQIIAFLDSLTDRSFVADRHFSLPNKACGRRL